MINTIYFKYFGMLSTFSNILISVTTWNTKCTVLTLLLVTNICTVMNKKFQEHYQYENMSSGMLSEE